MDPSYDNSFGSFGYGGQTGVDMPNQQGVLLSPNLPKKKSKKGVVLATLLVILACVGLGVVVFLNMRMDNSLSNSGRDEALDSLRRATSYAYYCNDENLLTDLVVLRPSDSCLARNMMTVSIFSKNEDSDNIDAMRKYFKNVIPLFEVYFNYSSRFYSDDENDAGYFLRIDDNFILDALNFLDKYITDTPVVSGDDFKLSEKEYLSKFSNLAALESGVSDEYLALQKEFYESTIEMLQIYSEKGCASDISFTGECAMSISLDEEQAMLLADYEELRKDIDSYGSKLTTRFFNRCIGNEVFFIDDEEKETENV